MNRLGISGYTALSGNKLLLKSRYEQRSFTTIFSDFRNSNCQIRNTESVKCMVHPKPHSSVTQPCTCTLRSSGLDKVSDSRPRHGVADRTLVLWVIGRVPALPATLSVRADRGVPARQGFDPPLPT